MTGSHKKVISVILVLCFLAAAAVVYLMFIKEPKPKYYIAVGDSVCQGFGVAPEVRYADKLYSKLTKDGSVNNYKNLGVHGYTTTMLLDLLKSSDEDVLHAFKNTRVVSVNIGGNNILQPFKAHMSGFAAAFEAMSRLTGIIENANKLYSDVTSIGSQIDITDITQLYAVVQTIPELFGNVTGVIDSIRNLEIINPFSLLFGTLPEEIDTDLYKGVVTFQREFNEIISWLREHAPDAVIIVNTIYNPLPKKILGFPIELSAKADELAIEINEIIIQNAQALGYKVADVYSVFEDEDNIFDILNFNLDMSTLNFNFDIIHPNNEGHDLIAELNYRAFKS